MCIIYISLKNQFFWIFNLVLKRGRTNYFLVIFLKVIIDLNGKQKYHRKLFRLDYSSCSNQMKKKIRIRKKILLIFKKKVTSLHIQKSMKKTSSDYYKNKDIFKIFKQMMIKLLSKISRTTFFKNPSRCNIWFEFVYWPFLASCAIANNKGLLKFIIKYQTKIKFCI
jgi:hypothetical protein